MSDGTPERRTYQSLLNEANGRPITASWTEDGVRRTSAILSGTSLALLYSDVHRSVAIRFTFE
jgi:hypothetical protein